MAAMLNKSDFELLTGMFNTAEVFTDFLEFVAAA